jgi:hypothetical protein
MIPPYLAEMIRRPTPARSGVLAGTVPVVSFGDPTSSRVATLGINPSSAEFLSKGVHFPVAKRRLATLQSLGATDNSTLTDDELFKVLTGLLMAHDYRLEPEAIPHLKRAIATMPRGRGFGNAREIERFFNRVVCNHAASLSHTATPSAELLQALGIREILDAAPWATAVAKAPKEPLTAGYL